LTKEQFRVAEDGRPQAIQFFAAEEAPLEIVMAMDISASMEIVVGYESTNLKNDGAWRRLEVTLPGTDHRVRARQGYFAPNP
jgi:hypothetical protein